MSEATLRVVQAPPKAMSVGELNRTVKAMVEDTLPTVWVEGEITAVKVSAGAGHVYFDLKDDREDARVSCVMWKGNAQKARAKLANGERVQLKGKPGLYIPRGQFQFVADLAVPAGAGAAAAALAALKARLQIEGLFAPERKRPLPRFPRAIGVVTSGSGAAFQDICREAHRRWPVRIVLASTLVQGADAPAQIVRAIERIQRVRGIDVVIVGRGGGASEDLAAFNDERVARAIAACPIPVVSAVGHEVDFTVADLVADTRAATPTMAATLCLPDWAEERDRVATLQQRLRRALLLKVRTLRVDLQRRSVRDPRRLLGDLRQRADDLTRRLADAAQGRVDSRRSLLDRADRALRDAHPRTRLASHRATLEGLRARLGPAARRTDERTTARVMDLEARLTAAMQARVTTPGHALGALAGRMHALSPVAILARGYGVVLHKGRALTTAAEVAAGDVLTVRLHCGEIDARVEDVRPGDRED